MAASDTAFTGSIPELYDAIMVPALMAPYARDLAARVATIGTGRVLETAAGTGILTEALAVAAPGLEIIATDLNRPMVDYATRKSALRGGTFRSADALNLPFERGRFDAVICQFGVMFFPDKVAGFRETHRVLKPGGRFVFNVWESLEHNPATAAAIAGLRRRYPDHGSWFMERTPHAYRDPSVIRADLAQGGFADCRIETVRLRGHAASAASLAMGICQGTPMRIELEELDPDGLQAATDAAANAIAERFGHDGPYETELSALVIEARR